MIGPSIRVLRFLNADGGFGALYLGVREDTQEPVVVKYLREPNVAGARRAFAREVRILGQRLRGFVELVAADLHAPAPYYVMAFADGGSLEQYAGRLERPVLLSFAREIADAVRGCHERNIAHGDLKPANILMRHGAPVVGDPLGNGAGCTVSFATKVGGTPGYCAPEICVDGCSPITPEGDVFSFGATLFHLATGIAPTYGMGVDRPWPFPAGFDRDMRQLILDATHPDPTMRPTMQRVWQRLRQMPPHRASARRNQAAGWLALGAIALLALAASGSR